jgi:anti-sigma regulatory factor (Ser/Thr protein kinase)
MRPMAARSPLDSELRLPPEATSIAIARNQMAEVARQVGAPEGDVKLAVSEAVSNAVTHAFRGREPGTITVNATQEPGRLRITVADNGIGMTPNLDSAGLGFGVSLIVKVANEVQFDSSANGTIILMAFDTTRESRAV